MEMVAGNNRVPRPPARMMPLNFGFVISRPAPSFLDHAQKPIPPNKTRSEQDRIERIWRVATANSRTDEVVLISEVTAKSPTKSVHLLVPTVNRCLAGGAKKG